MTDRLDKLQLAERAVRQRMSMNGSQNDQAEIAQNINPFAGVQNGNTEPLRLGYLVCDCICNCGSIVQVVRAPRKGTDDCLCMTCLELSKRHDPEHRPWPVSGVVILPPEK